MNFRKYLKYLLLSLALFSLIFGSLNQPGAAMPMSETDESKVPHYFGPYPNWANSPLTLPDAQVVITGNGAGAEAVATVGANGVITGITVTNPDTIIRMPVSTSSDQAQAQLQMQLSSRKVLL